MSDVLICAHNSRWSAPTATTATLFESGGTSGVEIDNIVPPSKVHTAQVYFSTLSDKACATSGKGGCAVQASQSGLD
jgi:hypothetical protein